MSDRIANVFIVCSFKQGLRFVKRAATSDRELPALTADANPRIYLYDQDVHRIRRREIRFKLVALVPAILIFLDTVDAVKVHVPEDYETVHQALFATSSEDIVIIREYYYRERIPRFDGMPTVVCEGWEPEFVEIKPRSPNTSTPADPPRIQAGIRTTMGRLLLKTLPTSWTTSTFPVLHHATTVGRGRCR
jgi:hypothetical protein